MKNVYITELSVEEKHEHDINVLLSENNMKHLILMGENGCGKTTILSNIAESLNNLVETDNKQQKVQLKFNLSITLIKTLFLDGSFVVGYFKDNRNFAPSFPEHVEKVRVKDFYTIYEHPNKEFLKYLLDLKVTEAISRTKGDINKANDITKWFKNFENLLKNVFDNNSLKLDFNTDTFDFKIIEKNRKPFDFNTLSHGFSALLDIVLDIMMRIRKKSGFSFNFNLPGIVLIDEIETHLHLNLQKRVMEFLTTTFPNIQFIISTHSPCILNNVESSIVYDLSEANITVN